PTLSPYTTLFRSVAGEQPARAGVDREPQPQAIGPEARVGGDAGPGRRRRPVEDLPQPVDVDRLVGVADERDRLADGRPLLPVEGCHGDEAGRAEPVGPQPVDLPHERNALALAAPAQ